MSSQIKTYKFRVKSNLGFLNSQSKKVNFVFNYCNETQKKAVKSGQKWLSGFDLNYLTAGSSKILGLHSGSIQAVCEQFAKSRQQRKKPWLRWRSIKQTGWIPFKGRDLNIKDQDFVFAGKTYKIFKSRELPQGAKIKDGSSFSQDARGRWYINIVLEFYINQDQVKGKSVGIDLGLKDFATLSNGQKFESPKSTVKYAERLAKAQRAKKKRLVSKLHDKIKNTRKDFQHKLSTKLTKEFQVIFVGNVNASKLAKTKIAKSILDAGWTSFRKMVAYKSVVNGVIFKEVNEANSTQQCSTCEDFPESRPKGIASLGIREWVCSNCGSEHDRDVNAALNILRYGQVSLVVGITLL